VNSENDNGPWQGAAGDAGKAEDSPEYTPATETPQRQRRRLLAGTKLAAIVRALLERGSLNCFQAALEHHDFVLRSTISGLRREYGFVFLKRDETVPGHNGSKVTCTRYSLTAEDRELARALLEVGQG
jgi:hypothetical protein